MSLKARLARLERALSAVMPPPPSDPWEIPPAEWERLPPDFWDAITEEQLDQLDPSSGKGRYWQSMRTRPGTIDPLEAKIRAMLALSDPVPDTGN